MINLVPATFTEYKKFVTLDLVCADRDSNLESAPKVFDKVVSVEEKRLKDERIGGDRKHTAEQAITKLTNLVGLV